MSDSKVYRIKVTDLQGNVTEEVFEMTDEQVAELEAAGAIAGPSTMDVVKRHREKS